LKYTMKELRSRKLEGVRFKNLEDSDKTQGRRKRRKPIVSNSNNGISTLSLEKKPKKKEILVREGGSRLGDAVGPRTGYDAYKRYMDGDKH
jgi:hypothetical protein